MIHVVIPHYRALKWLIPCLITHRQRQTTDQVRYSIVTMEQDKTSTDDVYTAVGEMAEVHAVPMPGMIGGQPLPFILDYCARLKPEMDITITVDPDALMLANGWDARLLGLFDDPLMAVAGINPRGSSNEFKETAEWNWMAYRTKFWLDHIGHFNCGGLHDIGHILSKEAAIHGYDKHLWGWKSHPFEGRAATVCGDSEHLEWVMHAFYSTRRREDAIGDDERRGILSAYEEDVLISRAMAGIQVEAK